MIALAILLALFLCLVVPLFGIGLGVVLGRRIRQGLGMDRPQTPPSTPRPNVRNVLLCPLCARPSGTRSCSYCGWHVPAGRR